MALEISAYEECVKQLTMLCLRQRIQRGNVKSRHVGEGLNLDYFVQRARIGTNGRKEREEVGSSR